MTNHLSVQLQAPSSTTINPFLLLPYFASLLSLVPRENWGCYHPHLAECIEIWAHLRQNPWPPLPPLCPLSRAYPPSTDSQGAELVQTARLYIHLNITRCTYSAVVYSPSSECAKLTGPTWLRCTHWPPCLLVSEMPFDCNDWSRILLKQFKNPPFFDPQSLFYQTFLEVLAFLDSWLLIVSLSLVGGLDGTTTGCRITMVAWLQLCVLNMAAPSKQIAEHANMDHFNDHVANIWLWKRLKYTLLI